MMKTVVVSDTNIFIDLVNLDLLGIFLRFHGMSTLPTSLWVN